MKSKAGEGTRDWNSMLRWLFGSRANQEIVERLHDTVMQAARHPLIYTKGGVPDTLEGRFDCVTLHMVLVLRRLKALPPPASDLASDLVDRLFAGFDQALREIGVGDVTIPKRMKTMASAFAGRAKAYEQAFLNGDTDLFEVLARNLVSKPLDEGQKRFWQLYLASCSHHLDTLDFASLTIPVTLFPAPESVAGDQILSGDRV
jgi:cytochrome b pre-mRNA-processing protein 3